MAQTDGVLIDYVGSTRDNSAVLDVRSANQGLMVPRVALTTGTASAAPVTSPAASLLIYNTATVGDVTPGYYYWNVTEWVRLVASNATPLTGTGATDKVAFWTSATDLGQNINFHWDNTNGRLGIGNAAPTQPLHVTGNARVTGNLVMANTTTITSGRIGRFANGTAAAPAYSFTSSTTTGIFLPVANELSFSTSSTERIRIGATGTVQLNAYTTNGIVRTSASNGTLTSGGAIDLTSEVTGILPVANGGTGSSTQGWVDLTTAQTAAGDKTWSGVATFSNATAIRMSNGTAALPALSFTGDPNTGMYWHSADAIGFSTAGVEKMSIATNGDIELNNKIAIRSNDAWLRLNPTNAFTSGVYLANHIRVDGGISSGNIANPGGGAVTATAHINSQVGFRIANAAVNGTYLRGNGTNYVSSAILATDLPAHTHAWSQITSKPAAWLDAANLVETLTNFNQTRPSGFYQGNSATNSPGATWYNMINVRHSNTSNDHGFQIAASYYDENIWTRTYQGGTGADNGNYTPWRSLVHSGNLGTNAILNQTTQQASSNFNISGAGVIGTSMNVGGRIFMNTSLGQASAARGISWYTPTYTTWFDYMAPAGATNAPSGTAAPSDAAAGVTSWARRFNIENAGTYGWLFESGLQGAGNAPTVKFAINAGSGTFHSTGDGIVDGVVYAGASARMGTNIAAGYYQDATNGAYRSLVSAATTNGYYFQTNAGAATTMYVGLGGTYNGNVGIGTLTPAYRLEVNGSIGLNRNNIHFQPSGGSVATDGSYGIYWHNSAGSTPSTAYGLYRTPGAWTASTYQQLRMQFDTGIELGPGTGDNAGYDRSYVNIINGKGLMVSSGNLGVGTTAPSHRLHVVGDIWAEGRYVVQNATDGGTTRGIRLWTAADSNWGIYMGTPGAGKSLSGGTAVAGEGFASHAVRLRVHNAATNGFIIENSSEQNLFSIRGNNGRAYFRGGVQFGCPGCGSTTTIDGTDNWGNMTIQGRVISANANIHLSPPGGSNVIINTAYRAAGGAGGTAGLQVQSLSGQGDRVVRADNNGTVYVGSPACPAINFESAYTIDFTHTRLCIYSESFNSSWNQKSNDCINYYQGAQMCTYQQVRRACAMGMPVLANKWLADSSSDDNHFRTNGTSCDNFDGTASRGSSYGVYCCLELPR